MAVLTITMFLSVVDRQILLLLITPIKRDMTLSDTQISLLIGAMFVIVYLGVGIPLSRLIDRGRRTWILALGVATWTSATAACGMVQTFWQLALARMMVGAGESCNAPATYSLVADFYSREKLARPLAVINIGSVLGVGFAFMGGGLLIAWLGSIGDVHLPLVGNVRAWQLMFLLAALPGLPLVLLILLVVPEPRRRDEHLAPDPVVPSLHDVVRHLFLRSAAYLPMILSTGVKSMLSFGLLVWSPSLFERKFGWEVGSPGLYIGALILLVCPCGLLVGGWLADRRASQGDVAANMRIVSWGALGLAPAAILYPLMPTTALAMTMLAIGLFMAMLGVGPGSAAVQRITPGRMRGTVNAVYGAAVNLMGYGLGPLMIALFTDRLYGSDSALPTSMALMACILAPIGCLLSWIAFGSYRILIAGQKQGSA